MAGSGTDATVRIPTTMDRPRIMVLELGQIDDSDIVWVNGVRIGSTTENWTQPRQLQNQFCAW